jgi:hypothetical protein
MENNRYVNSASASAVKGQVAVDRDREARSAALSMLRAQSCAKLLRSHGLLERATNLEAAVEEATEILLLCLGAHTMFAAINWANDRLWWDGCQNDWHAPSKALH